MAKQHLTEDTPFLRTPDMYWVKNDAPISEYSDKTLDLIADAANGGVPRTAPTPSAALEKRGPCGAAVGT